MKFLESMSGLIVSAVMVTAAYKIAGYIVDTAAEALTEAELGNKSKRLAELFTDQANNKQQSK